MEELFRCVLLVVVVVVVMVVVVVFLMWSCGGSVAACVSVIIQTQEKRDRHRILFTANFR